MNEVIRRTALATMMLNVLAMLIAGGVASAQPANPEPCKNVDASEVDAALGHAATPKMQGGEPKIDEESGARVWMCAGYYTRGEPTEVFDAMLLISVHELDTPAAAAEWFTIGYRAEADVPDMPALTTQPGVGDRARWGANSAASVWVAQKGRYIINVMLGQGVARGGELLPLKDPLKEPLKRLMIKTLAKL